MDTMTIPANEVTTPKAEKKQSSNVSKVSQTVNVSEYTGKDAVTIHKVNFADFGKGLGELLKLAESRCEFEYLGKKITVPSLTARNDNSARASQTYKSLIEAIFPASISVNEVISDKSNEGKILVQMRAKGWKFKTLCKSEVFRAWSIKDKVWKAKVNNHYAIVDALNKVDIKLTADLNADTKEIKAKTLAYITGLPVKEVKVIKAK